MIKFHKMKKHQSNAIITLYSTNNDVVNVYKDEKGCWAIRILTFFRNENSMNLHGLFG